MNVPHKRALQGRKEITIIFSSTCLDEKISDSCHHRKEGSVQTNTVQNPAARAVTVLTNRACAVACASPGTRLLNLAYCQDTLADGATCPWCISPDDSGVCRGCFTSSPAGRHCTWNPLLGQRPQLVPGGWKLRNRLA